MGIGIQICGLNGCGKSTLGKALAEKTGFHFIDNENLYFPRTSINEPYQKPKSRKEVETNLLKEIQEHNNFIFTAVKGDYGENIVSMYKYVIAMNVPKEIRIQRIRERSFQKFGAEMLLGGILYQYEEDFFKMAELRQDNYVENWLNTLKCPIIRIDGTKSIDENVEFVIKQINI